MPTKIINFKHGFKKYEWVYRGFVFLDLYALTGNKSVLTIQLKYLLWRSVGRPESDNRKPQPCLFSTMQLWYNSQGESEIIKKVI